MKKILRLERKGIICSWIRSAIFFRYKAVKIMRPKYNEIVYLYIRS